jgi:plasmid maintenance system antidote protein VapI
MATHIEEFAALLRELKERSGRSYGQLAARLHVSTSTLHRYCNGAAVPTDYAPVERLARLCGATPEELVTLHRRWLLADAARREPERPVETAEPAAPVEPAEQPEPVEEAPEPCQPVETGAPRRSRRSVVVLSAVAAIAVVAALPVALGGGDGGGTQNAAASGPLPTHTVTGPNGPNGPITPTSTTTAGATTGVSAPVSVSVSPTGSPAASSTTAGSTGGSGSGQPPLQVSVLADNWDMQCGQWFLMQQQPGEVPPPPSLEQTNAWASALGGVPGWHLRLQLTVQSLPGQSVVLHALYVHVISGRPAPKGTAYTPGSGCGGGLNPASFAVDLDATVPRTRPVAGYVGSGETSTLTNFPYQVSTGDPQVLDVDATTVGQDVSWYLELAWSSGDRQGLLPIKGDNGRPFRTVGLQGDPAYFYDGTTWSRTSLQG